MTKLCCSLLGLRLHALQVLGQMSFISFSISPPALHQSLFSVQRSSTWSWQSKEGKRRKYVNQPKCISRSEMVKTRLFNNAKRGSYLKPAKLKFFWTTFESFHLLLKWCYNRISEKNVIQSVTKAAWKIENPSTYNMSWTYDFLVTGSDALPLSYRRLERAKATITVTKKII